MQAIWQCGTGVVKDFMAKLPQKDNIPYTTVASVVRNLERKEYVESRKFGNTNVYTPIVLLADYKRHFMRGVVKDYFTDSYRDVVAFFVKEKNISKEELHEIIDLIEKGEQ